MKKKIALLLTVFLIPTMLFAHNPGGAVAIIALIIIFIILPIIASFFLTKRISRHITIYDEPTRSVILAIIGLVLFILITIISYNVLMFFSGY